ncbi:MAG TPA: BTAD domain-containing putative transcriptional regulator [Solirubrobacteraceae bacterium]
MVRYGILGPVEVFDGERAVAVGGPRQVALLALLLVNANRGLSSDRLIEALWHDRGAAGAVKRLQVAVARLRRALDPGGAQDGSVLRTTVGGYLLAVAPGELDAEVFQARVEEGRRGLDAGDPQRARDVLREALAIWRGRPLAEVADEEFAQAEIRRLEELRLSALEARVESELQLGEHAALVGELEALVAAHPARERLAAQLMLALYRGGRQGDALEVFARTRAVLSGEPGLEPGPALQALQAKVLAESPALQPVAAGARAAVATAPEPPAVLPSGVVTFLLTDIEGSSRLWEADPDAMAAALELHDESIARLVEHHDGRLLKDKGEGDATLSVFQRASDAVACAAGLQGDLAIATPAAPLDLRVRMALHSGEAQERDDDYFGPVLNRAARLRALAVGGQTVVSQTTSELVRDRLPDGLALVDLGLHELRGMSRPERVFELRAATGDDAGGAGGRVELPLPRSLQIPADAPLVGRGDELGRLRERWAQVCAGTRSAVVMGGEAGIGKTRLASELARAVHEQGALVLYGRCDEGLAVPYQPFVETLRPYARAVGLDRLRAELGDLAAELERLLPELTSLGEPMRADPESERFALFEAVAALLESATREQCALLLVDDLHWAAHPTLLLLRHLIRSERPLNLLILGTYRETELDASHPLAQLLADLHRDASVQLVSIRGLDVDAIATLVRAAGGNGVRERSGELAQLLLSETAGNPFYVRELLAHLVESGAISRDAALTELDVPERLRHVIRNRVGRLSRDAQRALRVAAVAGPRFSPALLEAVLGERADVIDALDEAVAAGLLTEAGHGEHAFGHALVRQTIYSELGSARRMRLHGRLGEALEATSAAHTRVELLAHHFAEAAAAGHADKAAGYALAASRSAIARLGYEEAVAHCERGLEALAVAAGPDDRRRCELLLTLGEACSSAGDIERARRTCMQAADLAEAIGDHRQLARAALGYCGPLFFSIGAATTEPSAGLLRRALDRLGEEDAALRAQLMGRLAAALAYAAAPDRRPELAREALALARRTADAPTLADVLATTDWTIRGPDSLHECLAMTQELAQLADEVGDVRLRTYAQQWLVDHLLELGEIDRVERQLQAWERRVELLSKRHYLGWLLAVVRARHAHLGGRLEQAEASARDALTHGYEGQDEPVAHAFGAQMLFVRREQGRLDDVVPAVRGFADFYPHMPAWRCALAWVHAELGQADDAREVLDGLAHAGFEDLPRDGLWLGTVASLAEVVTRLGDVARAQALYDLLLPFAGRCVVLLSFICEGAVARPLGMLATVMSRYEEASAHFEAALECNSRIGSALWVAYTQHEYARMLLRRGQPGDRSRAGELLDAALATADELGLTSLAERVRPLRLGAPERT